MLARVSMEDFNKQITQELSKLDKRFHNLEDLNAQPRPEVDQSSILRAELGCDVCPQYFHSSAQLILHQKTHTGQIPSICGRCLKSFSLQENLVSHECRPSLAYLTTAGAVAAPSVTRRCGACREAQCACVKTGGDDGGLRAVRGSFSCQVCRKSFANPKYLKVHMRVHSSVAANSGSSSSNKFCCSFCKKTFAYRHVLKMHMMQHYGSRVYQCTLCSITFPTKREMEEHFMNHDTDESGQMVRLCSSGSLGSVTDSSDRSATPTAPVSRSRVDAMTRAADFSKCSPADLILPSINSIYSDEVVDSHLPKIVRSSPKVSVVRHNPVFPITDGLITKLMAEDKAKFGDLPAVRVPSLSEMTSTRTDDLNSTASSEEDCQDEPMDLSNSLEPINTSRASRSFSTMSQASLPPIKRRLASTDSSRSSVIQFALKNEI